MMKKLLVGAALIALCGCGNNPITQEAVDDPPPLEVGRWVLSRSSEPTGSLLLDTVTGDTFMMVEGNNGEQNAGGPMLGRKALIWQEIPRYGLNPVPPRRYNPATEKLE